MTTSLMFGTCDARTARVRALAAPPFSDPLKLCPTRVDWCGVRKRDATSQPCRAVQLASANVLQPALRKGCRSARRRLQLVCPSREECVGCDRLRVPACSRYMQRAKLLHIPAHDNRPCWRPPCSHSAACQLLFEWGRRLALAPARRQRQARERAHAQTKKQAPSGSVGKTHAHKLARVTHSF